MLRGLCKEMNNVRGEFILEAFLEEVPFEPSHPIFLELFK